MQKSTENSTEEINPGNQLENQLADEDAVAIAEAAMAGLSGKGQGAHYASDWRAGIKGALKELHRRQGERKDTEVTSSPATQCTSVFHKPGYHPFEGENYCMRCGRTLTGEEVQP